TGFVSAGYVRMCLNPEQKDESKATIKSKVRNSNAQVVAHTTTGQTVQEPTFDESKAPDQGIITGDEPLPQGKEYWKPDPDPNIASFNPDTVPVQAEDELKKTIEILENELTTAKNRILE